MARLPQTLSQYPLGVVRIACRRCPRAGAYKLARLAARYGPEFSLQRILGIVAGDCPLWNAPVDEGCGAVFVDLEPPVVERTDGSRVDWSLATRLSEWPSIHLSVVCASCDRHETYRRADLIANAPAGVTLEAVLKSLVRNCRFQRVQTLQSKCAARLKAD
jgi:hypothetical protein